MVMDFDPSNWTVGQGNLLQYSQDFSNGAWGKNGITITSGVTAPDGTTSATTLTANGIYASHNLSVSLTAGYVKCYSIYVKAGTNNFAQVYFDVDSNPYVNFDISEEEENNDDDPD